MATRISSLHDLAAAIRGRRQELGLSHAQLGTRAHVSRAWVNAFERVAAPLRNAMPASESERAVRRFADALIWNWLIAGTDAHAKNYSLLLAGDQVRLAPLYDYRVELWHNPWPRAARDLRLDAEELSARVDDLAQRAPDAFADATRDPQVTALARPLPGTLADRVADRVHRCREQLTRSAPS